MKHFPLMGVFTIALMQISFAQDYSSVSKIVRELQQTLHTRNGNQVQHESGTIVALGGEKTGERTSIEQKNADTTLTASGTPERRNDEESSSNLNIQSKFGVDIYSRYIWRGLDYGNAPSLQPSITFTAGGLSVGTWAAYSMGASSVDSQGTGKVFAEHDLWASYGISTDAGTFSLFYTDYFYPSAGLKYFDFNGTNGAHVLEIGVGFTGTEKLPVTITAYYNFHNDADHSVYIQGSYLFSCESFSANLFVAVTPAKSVWYGTSKADIINAGVTVSKSIMMTDKFSLPLTVSYIINPDIEQTYLIVGITL
jgi:hypothetical protein